MERERAGAERRRGVVPRPGTGTGAGAGGGAGSGTGRTVAAAAARATGELALLTALYAVLPLQGDRWWVGSLVGVVALAALAPVTIRRTRAVRSSDRPVAAAVEGLAVLLGMLVLGFSALYLALDRHGTQFAGLDTRVDAVYFTVSTLSTVGFGDIVATGQAARLAVVVQVLMDVVLIGVAVRALTASARDRLGQADGPHR